MIVRHSFATRISKVIDINGKPHVIKRKVYWEKALELNPDFVMIDKPWQYFYYEVEPVDKTTGQTTLPDTPPRTSSI